MAAQFLDIEGLEKFSEFIEEINKMEPKYKRRLIRSAFKASAKIIQTAQKAGVSSLKKRTGYLKKSLRMKSGRGKKWTYIRVGNIDPKPYLLKSNNTRFNAKGIKKASSGTRYKPRPSTYAGIWHEYGYKARGKTAVKALRWFTKSYKDNREAVNKMIVADMEKTIAEIKKNY